MILNCNALNIPVKDKMVQCVVTSPPYYGLRDYGVNGQIGLESTPDEYVSKLVQVFREVKRVLKDDGTLWLNLGDSYAGGQSVSEGGSDKQRSNKGSVNIASNIDWKNLKPKDLIGIPWMVAFALRADGWYLRSDIIWAKPNPMPESVKDRPTKSHEYLFLLSKSQKYYYDAEAIEEVATGYDGRKDTLFKGSTKYKDSGQTFAENGHERWKFRKGLQEHGQQPCGKDKNREAGIPDPQYPVRNKRTVWTINTQPFKGAHFAVMPEKLVEPCILAGSKEGDLILDPFAGSGTVGVVAQKFGRQFVGTELNPEYVKIAESRLLETPVSLFNQSYLLAGSEQ